MPSWKAKKVLFYGILILVLAYQTSYSSNTTTSITFFVGMLNVLSEIQAEHMLHTLKQACRIASSYKFCICAVLRIVVVNPVYRKCVENLSVDDRCKSSILLPLNYMGASLLPIHSPPPVAGCGGCGIPG